MSNNYNFTPTLDGLNNINGDIITCTTLTTENLTVTDNADIKNDLAVGGDVDTTGNLNVSGNTTIGGSPNFALIFARNGGNADGGTFYTAYTQGTIECWIKPQTPTSGTQYVMGVQNYFMLLLNNGILQTQDFSLTNTFRSTGLTIPPNVWTHVALVFDLTTPNATKIYRNGLPVLTTTIAPPITPPAVGFQNFIVGTYLRNGATSFSGVVDDCRIWDIKRTDAEILADYNSIISPTTPNLTGYWLFNEGGYVEANVTTTANSVTGGPALTFSPTVGGSTPSPPYWTYGRLTANLNVTGEFNTTNIKGQNLILGGATYNQSVQLKMDGIVNIGNKVNVNNNSRAFNIRDTNGLISIGRFANTPPGFELRNYDATTNALLQDVLFNGPTSSSESWSWLFRSPGAGGDFQGGGATRTLFRYNTPLLVQPTNAMTPGGAYTTRFANTTSGNNVDVVLNPLTGSFIDMVSAGDAIIVNSNAGKSLVLCANNTTNCGIKVNSRIRMGGTNVEFDAGTYLIFNGGGYIRQDAATGINLLNTITMNPSTSISFSGTGRINQSSGTGTNLMSSITLNNNNDLVFQGTGKINQSGGTGTNLMEDITLNSNANVTFQGTGIVTQSGTGTNSLKDTQVTGILNITGYANVKTELDNINTSIGSINTSITTINSNITGITYLGALTDETQIDNNVILTSGKYLEMNGAGGGLVLDTGANIIQSGAGTNILTSTTIQGDLTFDDGTTQDSKYIDDMLNDADAHGYVMGKTIRFVTFNISNATNAALVALGANYHFATLVRLVKGITYTGIGIYTGTAGTFEVALYNTGLTPSRIAYSNAWTTTANGMSYLPFSAPFANTTTKFAYAIIRTVSAAQTVLYLPSNTFLNYGSNTMTNSTLNKRTQFYPSTAAFSAYPNIASGIAQTIQTQQIYLVLYS